MFLAQCVAIMPLVGIRESNPRRVRFAYKSIPMFVTLIFMIATSILFLSMFTHLLKIGITAKNFGKSRAMSFSSWKLTWVFVSIQWDWCSSVVFCRPMWSSFAWPKNGQQLFESGRERKSLLPSHHMKYPKGIFRDACNWLPWPSLACPWVSLQLCLEDVLLSTPC